MTIISAIIRSHSKESKRRPGNYYLPMKEFDKVEQEIIALLPDNLKQELLKDSQPDTILSKLDAHRIKKPF